MLVQPAWAAWRFTGDEKYLRPVMARIARAGTFSIADLNENAATLFGADKDWGRAFTARAKAGGGAFERWGAWNFTGDTAWLEALHADAIADKVNHDYMNTEGHWWSDRVEAPSEILQRERLGGIALKRNQTWPGHTRSWRFDDPEGAIQTAILVPGATRERFKVIAYNSSDRPQTADMTAWNVTAGEWEMKRDGQTSTLPLERSASTRLTFAPRMTTEIEFTLRTPTTPTDERPDLGIGVDDVQREGSTVTVTVHSLGAKDVPAGGRLWITDTAGAVRAEAAIPALAAPLDLQPRTVTVRLKLFRGDFAGLTAHIALPGNAPEVTRRNNSASVPGR